LANQSGWRNIHTDNNRVDVETNNALLLVDGDTAASFTIQNTEASKGSESSVPYWSGNAAAFLSHSNSDATGVPGFTHNIKHFRSGYIEFTIKTNKNNCIVASGNADYASMEYGNYGPQGTFPEANTVTDVGLPSQVTDNLAYLVDPLVNKINSKINIENGKLKLSYNNLYGNNKKSFSITSNSQITDNEWHHVVINFGKPGVIRTHGKKHNQRFIEIWIDGNLDLSGRPITTLGNIAGVSGDLKLSGCKNIKDVSALGHVHTLILECYYGVTGLSALGNVHTLIKHYVLDEEEMNHRSSRLNKKIR
jgi:hypothetical protein